MELEDIGWFSNDYSKFYISDVDDGVDRIAKFNKGTHANRVETVGDFSGIIVWKNSSMLKIVMVRHSKRVGVFLEFVYENKRKYTTGGLCP